MATASKEIKSGQIVPLNLPLDVPKVPAFNRQEFKHEIKALAPGAAYDDIYTLNTQSGTQWDGLRHIAHMPSKTFYNGERARYDFRVQILTLLGTKGKDIEGPEKNGNCGIHHWAQHGIAGRGVLIDYWTYANEKGIAYGRHASFLRLFTDIKLVKDHGCDFASSKIV